MLRPVTSGRVCPRPGLKVPQVAFALSRLPPGKKDTWDREVLATHVLLQAARAWATHTRVQWGSGSPDRPWPLSFTVIPARAALLHSSLPDPASQPKARLSPQGGPCRLERTSSSDTGNSHSRTQCHIRTELRCLKSFLQLPPPPVLQWRDQGLPRWPVLSLATLPRALPHWVHRWGGTRVQARKTGAIWPRSGPLLPHDVQIKLNCLWFLMSKGCVRQREQSFHSFSYQYLHLCHLLVKSISILFLKFLCNIILFL